jgi:hypothetical protein
MLDKLQELERRGGGIDDMWKYVHLSDRHFVDSRPFELSDDDIVRRLGASPGIVSPVSLETARTAMKQNFAANPGPTFKALGFKNKREGAAVAWDLAGHIINVSKEKSVIGLFTPRYALAGRTKLAKKSRFVEKQLAGEPFGRAVWMADQHEQIMCGRFVQPLLEYFHSTMSVVCLGLNKFSDDPSRVAKSLERFNCFINGDFSSFDLNTSPRLIARAFSVIRILMGLEKFGVDSDSRCMDWIENQFINTPVVLPTGRAVLVPGGIPSGSGMTSIIGTIVNAIVWMESLHSLGIEDYELKTSGDDNYLGINVSAPSPEGRVRRGKTLCSSLSAVMAEFGQELSVDKTKVGAYLYAGYSQPLAPELILDGSSRVLNEFWQNKERLLGRKLMFVEKYRILQDEPIGPAPGTTHRWNYLFHLRAPFLSHYFKKDRSQLGGGAVMFIRPTAEVIENLVYPEHRVKTLNEHLDRLQCALAENLGNHHVVNRIMHYTYDSFLLEEAGVSRYQDIMRLQNHPAFEKRAWYRREKKVIDLLYSDLDFSEYWERFLRSAKVLHSAIFGERYSDWGTLRAVRRGKVLQSGGIGLGGPAHNTIYSSLEKNPQNFKILGAFGLACQTHPEIRASNFDGVRKVFEKQVFEQWEDNTFRMTCKNIVLRESLEGGVLST